jgi:hypothetical protein
MSALALIEHGEHVAFAPGARCSTFERQPIRELLQELIGRGRHTRETALEDNLSRQVIGLDGPRAPGQTLPCRSPATATTGHGPQPQLVASPLGVLIAIHKGNTRGFENGDTLCSNPLRERSAARLVSTHRFDGVAEVHEELASLPPRDVLSSDGVKG